MNNPIQATNLVLQRYTREMINVDILRMILNKSLIYSLIVLINGHGQAGKTTFDWFLGNRFTQIRNGIPLRKATWQEWNWKENTMRTAKEFVKRWDECNGEYLALEEAGETLNYLDWFSTMARVFASTTRTQGLKRNVCALITPHSSDIQKHNKENIDFKIWVRKRVDKIRLAVIVPRYIKIDYLKDKWKLGFIRNWNVFYTPKMLAEAKKYTDWLKEWKSDIADKNMELVGLYNPNRPITTSNMPEWVEKLLYA